jgi:shikimate dehydrogenase
MRQNRVGVIGWPIAHSLSPIMHNAAFNALGMNDWSYDAMAIAPERLESELKALARNGYVGVNVTVPHKQDVLRLVQPDDKARAIGAVNTIDFRDNTGTNTDVDGFLDDLQANDVPIEGEPVVILGAGGSARAIIYGLAQAGAHVAIVNRSVERAFQLIGDLRLGNVHIETKTLEEAAQWCPTLIVNCTPVGMWPKVDHSPWPDRIACPEGTTVYDLVYRPAKTKLMQQIEASGGRSISGLGMLVRQGAAAFKIWTGVEPPIEVMLEAAQAVLEQS